MYKNLEIWKFSVNLIKNVYKIAEKLPKSEEYNLKSQLKRAVVSVSLNIAEGKSRKTGKDFAHFLGISSGSLTEVEAILTICQELKYITPDENIFQDISKLNKQINSMRNHVLNKGNNNEK